MTPEVRLKFVAFLEVGTELNFVRRKKKNAHCDKMRLKKVYVTLLKTNGTGSDGRTRAERREK